MAARGRAAASGSQGGEEVDVGRRDPRRAAAADVRNAGPFRGYFARARYRLGNGSETAQS